MVVSNVKSAFENLTCRYAFLLVKREVTQISETKAERKQN